MYFDINIKEEMREKQIIKGVQTKLIVKAQTFLCCLLKYLFFIQNNGAHIIYFINITKQKVNFIEIYDFLCMN